jgi:hypothetical protein
MTMSLVVNQTCAVHAQIAEMFKAMRQHQDVQVAVEVRFISLSEAGYERLKKDFGFESNGARAGMSPEMHISFHDDKQVYQMLEAVQGDCHANIMQTPKLTLFNGQCSTIEITEKKQFVTGVKAKCKDGQTIACPETETISVGTLLKVQPVVSADQQFVRLKLGASLTSLVRDEVELFPVVIPMMPRDDKGNAQEPVILTQFIQQPCINSLNLETTIEVAAGRTAVLSGWKRTKEHLQDDTPPVVKDIPFLNEVFQSTKLVRKTECVLMMVTPRIIISAEEEKGAFEEEEEEMCWPFGKEPVPCPAPSCCKDKACPDGTGKPTVRVLDPDPNGFRDILITVQEQNTGTVQIGTGTTSGAGFTGNIQLKATFTTCEVAELLEKYHKACTEGRRAEATELAVRALALDPSCFHKAACGGKVEK